MILETWLLGNVGAWNTANHYGWTRITHLETEMSIGLKTLVLAVLEKASLVYARILALVLAPLARGFLDRRLFPVPRYTHTPALVKPVVGILWK
jgi:hypothetical protein